ncbi:MAG TPA: hypothetical protein P5528_09040 [Steroidobacteraceae bacterium]|nr:hypothetical protein [Steroidobacteraceae bacterium]HRX89577.1 hypothetical protein [Steroidobacteraceae bacterium]
MTRSAAVRGQAMIEYLLVTAILVGALFGRFGRQTSAAEQLAAALHSYWQSFARLVALL